MKRVWKFLHLPANDRRLFVQSLLLLWAIRLWLSLFTLQALQRVLARATALRTPTGLHKVDRQYADRIAWSVTAASRYVPGSTCLTRAFAAQVLLARRGRHAALRIGVAKSAAGQLEAHAWVESEGKIVIGGLEELARYSPLPSLDRAGS